MRKTSAQEVSDWIQNLENGFTGGACFNPSFLKPFHLVTLATELKRHAHQELQLKEKLLDYAIRMNLWEAIGMIPPYRTSQSKESKMFLPLVPLWSSNKIQEATHHLTQILKSYCLDTITCNSITSMLLELLDNCFSHAAIHDDLHGLACCQSWPKGKLAQIALVDAGIGIRQSLSENHHLNKRLKGENACELATEYGVTSKPGSEHAGYGLSLARGLVEGNVGNLIIISGTETFQLCEGKQVSSALDVPWKGTLVLIEFNMDRTLDVKETYQQWPLPDGIVPEDLS